MHKAYEHLDNGGKKFLFIFLLILYFILSAGVNIYKIICNVIYDPIAKSLPAYFLNPAFIIYIILLKKMISKVEEKGIIFILFLILFYL